VKVPIKTLRRKTLATLEKKFTKDQAERIADCLLWADMSGIKTHGVMKLTGVNALQGIAPRSDITVERDTTLSQRINAGAHPAPLVCQQATDVVIQKAKEHGFGIVAVHNTFSSNGAQAYYVQRIAKEDLIGISMARGPACFAPFDSIDRLFGTNPIGFAFPTKDEPLVFDMTTSTMAWYALILAHIRGEQLPENLAIDCNGDPTTDPSEALQGALLPFDGSYKGSGLGMIVEIMAGPLAGAAYCSSDLDDPWGSTFIAIDPNLLIDIETFKASCSDLITKVKASRKKSGIQDIRLPGERASKAYKEAEASGMVEVDKLILEELGYLDE
jgi:L-2-hydroxycarboxylate dehydrogenase (NAD+)